MKKKKEKRVMISNLFLMNKNFIHIVGVEADEPRCGEINAEKSCNVEN